MNPSEVCDGLLGLRLPRSVYAMRAMSRPFQLSLQALTVQACLIQQILSDNVALPRRLLAFPARVFASCQQVARQRGIAHLQSHSFWTPARHALTRSDSTRTPRILLYHHSRAVSSP